MKKLTSSTDLYTEFIRDLYSAEVQEIPALRAFQNLVSSQKMRSFIQQYVKATRMQILRLEELIAHQQESLVEDHCRTMKSMITEVRELATRCEEGPLRDTAILASMKRIKHCQVLIYRMLIQMADELGMASDSETLECNLKLEMGMLDILAALSGPKQEITLTMEV